MDKYTLEKATDALIKKSPTNRIIRYFPNTDMRCYHDGLRKISLENKLDPHDLRAGEFLVFANSRQNRLKVFGPGNIICYMRSPDNKRIDLNVVRLLPRFFNGKTFNFDGAVAEMLQVKLRKTA